MEIFKAILALITSFFQHSTIQATKEVKLSEAETNATIETIRASENAKVVQLQQAAQEDLVELRATQEANRVKQISKSLDEQIDEQLGSD